MRFGSRISQPTIRFPHPCFFSRKQNYLSNVNLLAEAGLLAYSTFLRPSRLMQTVAIQEAKRLLRSLQHRVMPRNYTWFPFHPGGKPGTYAA